MNHQYVKNVVEASLLAAGRPLTLEELASVFDERDGTVADEVKGAIAALPPGQGTNLAKLLSRPGMVGVSSPRSEGCAMPASPSCGGGQCGCAH